MSLPDDWVRNKHIEYSPSRYDPDAVNEECLECDTQLRTAGDRAGAIKQCPGCGVTVMLI